tara:strand:- start:241 stop:1140 length:900 start_codon:yes stop_codon:yes gene_type:complete
MKKLVHSKPKILIKCNASLAEGPIWNHETKELTFVDILGKSIFVYKNKKNIKKFKSNKIVSSFLPKKRGEWIACSKNKIYQVKIINKKLFFKKINTIKQKKNNRLNDAAIDKFGRLWVSSMDEKEISNSGHLIFFKDINSPTILFKNFIIGNGIDWSPSEKIIYFSVSDKRKIYKFGYQKKTGKISKKKVFATIPFNKGKPDGISIDREGYLWVACWDGGCVIRFNVFGKIDKIIKMPISRPTSVCFGGKNLNTLYVTSAKKIDKLNKIEKNSGNIFYVKTNIKGIKTNFFKQNYLINR